MSENKHTPEPWVIGRPPPNGEQTIGDKNGLMVAVATTGYGVNSEANARRITACVNRLAQFTTEQIEDFGYDLFAEDRPRLVEAQNEIHLLKKQRDELLAALERFATWARGQHKAQSKGCHATFDMMMLRDEIDFAEAAIKGSDVK